MKEILRLMYEKPLVTVAVIWTAGNAVSKIIRAIRGTDERPIEVVIESPNDRRLYTRRKRPDFSRVDYTVGDYPKKKDTISTGDVESIFQNTETYKEGDE
jgi:hypothetical protein